MNSPNDREVAVFGEARDLPPEERAAYLDEACANDLGLRQRVEDLLREGEEAGTFLREPAPGTQRPPEAGKPALGKPVGGEKAGDRVGRYRLLEQIGEGGCGVVYMAEQEEPIRRRVALKVIKLGMDTKQVIARFEAERQALALMDHPNIAKVLDAGATETGRPFFVMELVRGIKITRFCDENNLSTEERLKLFVQICHAIQHAHQKGIIHRDIKPSNILVAQVDGEPGPKIIDFGVAKATGGQALTERTLFTSFAQFIGTPAYMSPEQAELSVVDVDTRSDVYALGVLLYELLTGKTPFDQQTLLSAGLDQMRRIICEQEPARPSTRLCSLDAAEQTTLAKRRHSEPPKLIHQLHGDLDWIVMKALEKDRRRRYETANALAIDIEHHLQDEPVVARPPSKLYRLRKVVRRNRLLFAAGSAVMVALAIGFGAATAMFLRERAARTELLASEGERAIERAEVAAIGGDFGDLERALKDAQQRGVPDVRLLILRGFYSIHAGRWRDALEPLQRAVQLAPQSVAPRALLASIYKPKDWQRYEEQLRALQPLEPVTWDDYLFKGEAIGVQDPAVALALIDKAVALKSNSPLARLARAQARTDQAMSASDLAVVQSALDDLKAASQFVAPDNFLLMSTFAWVDAQAARLYGEAGRLDDHKYLLDEAELWGRRLEHVQGGEAARIVQLEVCGRDDEAFAYMQRILPQHQHDPDVLYYYGNALYRRGRVQEAHDAYAAIPDMSSGAEHMRLIARMELSGGGVGFKRELDEFYLQHSGLSAASAPDTYRLAGLAEEARRWGVANYQDSPNAIGIFTNYFKIAQFRAGLIDEAALMEAGRGSKRMLVIVYTSLAIQRLAKGDRATAKEKLQKAVQTGMYESNYYQLARVLLARLENDPNWPPWIPLRQAWLAPSQGQTPPRAHRE